MIRRLSGLALLIIGLAGVILSIVGVAVSGRVVASVANGLDATLELTARSLATMEETLMLARNTIDDVNASLETVGQTADSLAKTLEDTRPIIDQVAEVTSQDAPNSIESVQAAIPNMAEVAGVIDDTLVTLSAFRIEETILGIPLEYDLGIDYQPAVPFDETVTALGSSLDGLPERLRELEPDLVAANANLAVVSENIYAVSSDLEIINGRIAEVGPLLEQYVAIVRDINSAIQQTQALIRQQLEVARIGLQVVMVWLGFMQFALLYLGWDLLTRSRRKEAIQDQTSD